MSTQVGFDLTGLLAAMQRGDLDHQLALYAADAKVRVAGSDGAGSVSVYHGRNAIRGWLRGLDFDHVTHRVDDVTRSDEGILLTDVIQHRDGRRMIYHAALRLDRGQIINQDVTLIGEDRQG